MKVTEAINRGYNLLGTSIVGLAGFAFMPEIFLEKDWDDKADDIALLIVAVVGIIWYLSGKHKYQHSIMPVVFVVLSLLIKIGAVIVEFKDKEAVGDDLGALVLFTLATILITYQFIRTKKLLKEASS